MAGERDDEHARCVKSVGSRALTQAAGSNYSIDLSTGTEAIVGHYPVLSDS
jgi:hypothetical protein